MKFSEKCWHTKVIRDSNGVSQYKDPNHKTQSIKRKGSASLDLEADPFSCGVQEGGFTSVIAN